MEVTPASEWRRTIKFELSDYGMFELKRVFVSDQDIELYAESRKAALSPREFAVQFIHQKLINPSSSLDVIRSWPDDLLEQILNHWSKNAGVTWDERPECSTFEAFQQFHEAYCKDQIQLMQTSISESITKLTTSIGDLAKQIAANFIPFSQQFASIQESLQHLSQQYFTSVNAQLGQIFSNTPVFSEIAMWLQEIEHIDPLIEASGYGFLNLDELSISFLYDLAQANRVHPKSQKANITKKLWSLTCSEEFKTELHTNFHASSVLKRRWKVIEAALEAHQTHQYFLSVPPLIAQVEGTYTDLLVLKEMAFRKGRDVFTIQKGMRGKKVIGLNNLIERTDLKNDPAFVKVADFLLKKLVPQRNAILHGRVTTYNKAQLSIQLLLALFVLSSEIAALERGKIVL